jgi:hypothetical protein
LRPYYFHSFTADPADQTAFSLFVQDDIHRLQANDIFCREHLQRFSNLTMTPFAQKKKLLNNALEELITIWGPAAEPPQRTVLAIAATLGCCSGRSSNTLYGHGHGFHSGEAMGSMVGSLQPAKEQDHQPSKIVCEWLVRHCPPRRDLRALEAGLEEDERDGFAPAVPYGRLGTSVMGRQTVLRYSEKGIGYAAETLYHGEKTFKWLPVLNFLQEPWPPALNASQCNSGDGEALMTSFLSYMREGFQALQNKQAAYRANTPADSDERAQADRGADREPHRDRAGLLFGGVCVLSLVTAGGHRCALVT